MWTIILLGFFGVISESFAQDVTNADSPTVTQTPSVNQGIDWDTTKPMFRVNFRDEQYNTAQNEDLEKQQFYSNQWRSEFMPIYIKPYRDSNLQPVESKFVTDPEFTPNFSKNDDSESYQTVPPAAESDTENRYPVFSDSINHYPYSQRAVQNQFSVVPLPVRPQMFYPNAVNINLRRSYTTNVREVQNSSDSSPSISATEPVTESYEERYTQVLPNAPYPNMPVLPNRFWPFGNMNQQGFYPQPAPFYYRQYPIPGPGALPPTETTNPNVPLFDREAGSESIENSPDGKQLPEFGSPVPTGVRIPAGDVPRIPQTFVPTNPMQTPVPRYPFIWPPPVYPPFVPNPVPSGILPWNPSPLPETIPRELPNPEIIPDPVRVDNALPFVRNPVEIPPVEPLVNSAASDSVETGDNVEANLKPSRIPYEFGYDMNDGKGTDQHRVEASDASGVVTGSYGYRNAYGVYRLVNYIADKNGFRAFVKSNEPGVPSSGSADVVVVAEGPPPPVETGESNIEELDVVVRPEPADLIAQGSETGIE